MSHDDAAGIAKTAANQMPVDELAELIYQLKDAIATAKRRIENAKF